MGGAQMLRATLYLESTTERPAHGEVGVPGLQCHHSPGSRGTGGHFSNPEGCVGQPQ